MSKTSFTLAAAGLLFVAGQASADTINFDSLPAGTVLSNQYAGVLFTANPFSGPGTSTSGQAWATNTDMTVVSSTGTDVGGLGTPSLVSGNLLRSFNGWLNEDGDASFAVSFANPVTSFSAAFAGVSTGADVRLFVFNGSTLLGSVAGTTTGQFVLSFSAPSITRVVVGPGSFNDWVGVDNITYTPSVVPEPGSWALMGLGLALLALKRREQRQGA